MISFQYTKGNIEAKIDGHRHVLQSAKTLPDGTKITQSDLSNELPIIKAVAEAVFATRTRTKGVARFNESTGCVRWDGRLISPEESLTGLPSDIKAFCTAVRTPETLKTFADQKEPEYETDDIPHSKVQLVDGAPVLVNTIEKRIRTKSVRVKNEDGTLAFKQTKEGREPLFAEVAILKN